VFLGSGLGHSGRPGMTFLGKNNFFIRSFAGKTMLANTTVNLLIGSEHWPYDFYLNHSLAHAVAQEIATLPKKGG